MNATKRKFNALIQGLGNRSSPSRPSSEQEERNGIARNGAIPNSPVPPSPSPSIDRTAAASSPKVNPAAGLGASSPADDYKRRRVGILATTTGNVKTVPSTPSSFVARLGLSSKERRAGGISLPAPEPKFCPGDRDQLIRRLATFQELTEWTPKPDKLNEIEWAKRGWVCQGKERVRCTLCNKELVVQTSARREADGKADSVSVTVSVTVDSGVQEAVVNKFADLIVEAHTEDCLWRKRACDGKSTSNSHLFCRHRCLGFYLVSDVTSYYWLCTRPRRDERADNSIIFRRSSAPAAFKPSNCTHFPP